MGPRHNDDEENDDPKQGNQNVSITLVTLIEGLDPLIEVSHLFPPPGGAIYPQGSTPLPEIIALRATLLNRRKLRETSLVKEKPQSP